MDVEDSFIDGYEACNAAQTFRNGIHHGDVLGFLGGDGRLGVGQVKGLGNLVRSMPPSKLLETTGMKGLGTKRKAIDPQ